MQKVLLVLSIAQCAGYEKKKTSFVRSLIRMGYLNDYTVGFSRKFQVLPELTFWKKGVSLEQVKLDLIEVAEKHQVNIQSYKAVVYTDWIGGDLSIIKPEVASLE